MTDFKKLTEKFSSDLQKRFQAEQEELLARQKKLDKQYGEETPGGDKNLDNSQQHNYTGDTDAAKKNFDQKVYMFPASFNALRVELENYWPTLWNTVEPETGTTLGWDMAFDAPTFVRKMNTALQLDVQMDSDNVSEICDIFWQALRNLRGPSTVQ